MMGSLKQKIVEHIIQNGPISLAQYMQLCLFDPEYGYYTTSPNPFGAAGDFITAPDISQMFGEMLAVFLLNTYVLLGQPKAFILAEMGPGRGTLMADILRSFHKIRPELLTEAQIFLIESSPHLTNLQKQCLSKNYPQVHWVKEFSSLPRLPLLFFCNELLDALPIEQFVFHQGRFIARKIALDPKNNLTFCCDSTVFLQETLAHPILAHVPLKPATVVETSLEREALITAVASHLKAHSGCGLFIDYGSLTPAWGDTLQAVSRHQYQNIFAAPGAHDLTSHVDFYTLAHVAQRHGCLAAGKTQGAFLRALGLLERAACLGAGKPLEYQQKITQDVMRLTSDMHMGRLFKVFCITPHTTLPFPFEDCDSLP